jgi:hypothetical protein
MVFSYIQYIRENIHQLESIRVDFVDLFEPGDSVAVVIHKVEGLPDLAIEEGGCGEVGD